MKFEKTVTSPKKEQVKKKVATADAEAKRIMVVEIRNKINMIYQFMRPFINKKNDF